MATAELGHRDVFGLKLGPSGVAIQVFQVRRGRVVERVELGTEDAIVGAHEGGVLEAAIQQFYEMRSAPAEIHVPAEPDDRDDLEIWLSGRAGRRVRIVVPQRGEKRGFVDLANRNAALAYQTRFNQAKAAQYDALETLQHVLALPSLPRRIECFDISTIQGSETVASMVVCEDGRMRRSDYRKFRIRGGGRSTLRHAQPPAPGSQPLVPVHDDFAAMHEVVLRRYRKLLEHGGLFPDLVLIDGGKGQMSAAYAALEELGLANLVAVGIAKKEELIYTRDREDPIALAAHDPALLLIQRIRDEAHRFAVTFHRQRRGAAARESMFDQLAGVGPARRRALLRHFGSAERVLSASAEELEGVPGVPAKTARNIYAQLHRAGAA
jgi:excinuclease ABC subunit C